MTKASVPLTAYLIFVNFGTPPYYLDLQDVYRKVRKFATKQPILVKMDHIFAFSMLNSTPAGKKYTTTGSVTVTNISYATAQCSRCQLKVAIEQAPTKIPILNGQFCHAISKNIFLNVLGYKQPREKLVSVILKL